MNGVIKILIELIPQWGGYTNVDAILHRDKAEVNSKYLYRIWTISKSDGINHRNAIKGFTIDLMRNPEFDVQKYSNELGTIFERSTKK